MDMSNFRPESHVAQQSRRDKLRIQQCSTSAQHLVDFTQNMDQSSVNPDLIQVRNIRNANLLYDPNLVSSEMINFSGSNVLSSQRDAILHQELGEAQNNAFTSLPQTISSHFNSNSSRTAGDFQGCSNWKSLSNSEWMMNFASGSASREGNQNAMLVGEVLSNNVKVSDISTSGKYLKSDNYNAYHQGIQSTLTNNPSSEISGQVREKHYGNMHYATPLYQNTIQDVVTLASIGGSRGLAVASLVQQSARETGQVNATWTGSGNELMLLPNYENQSSAFRYSDAGSWNNRSVESCHVWSTESGFINARKSDLDLRNVASDATPQGLSLSLSSNPSTEMHVAQFGEGYDCQELHLRADVSKEIQELKAAKSDHLGSMAKPSITSKGCGKSLQELVGTSSYNVHRGTGPLGPFTGYATILKGSRFLKPAQEVLNEFCTLTGSKVAKICDVSERISGDQVSASASVEADVIDAADMEVEAKGNNSSVVSTSTFYCTSQISCGGGVGSSSSESYRPEYQQKKAKLLYLQEEVCKRYKLYQQQMQMVVSSFESVAGLSAATPYVTVAFKTISKNFRCIRNAITNQMKHVTKALGEDLLSSATGTSTSKGDTNTSRQKSVDQSSHRQKSGGSGVGFLEPQHVWRPQRGLPERSVAILRAWLFEHFLHPYPTDTDKHMLATQTGLSRNQVSNWFINARVRVWKPMVEEIHMLETKSLAEANQNSKKCNGNSSCEGPGRPNIGDETMNKRGMSGISSEQLDYSGIGPLVGSEDGLSAEQSNQEKRSRVDCQVTSSVDRSMMSFIPYQRSGIEVGGFGAVSLTLGLRHGVESSQQQQQEEQLRRHLGGQIIHDFVG